MDLNELQDLYRHYCGTLFPAWTESESWTVSIGESGAAGWCIHSEKRIEINPASDDTRLSLIHEIAHAIDGERSLPDDHPESWRTVMKAAAEQAERSAESELAKLILEETEHEGFSKNVVRGALREMLSQNHTLPYNRCVKLLCEIRRCEKETLEQLYPDLKDMYLKQRRKAKNRAHKR